MRATEIIRRLILIGGGAALVLGIRLLVISTVTFPAEPLWEDGEPLLARIDGSNVPPLPGTLVARGPSVIGITTNESMRPRDESIATLRIERGQCIPLDSEWLLEVDAGRTMIVIKPGTRRSCLKPWDLAVVRIP